MSLYYWFASSYSQRIETLQNFLETDEYIRTLVVLDIYSANDVKGMLESLDNQEQIPCNVRLVLGTPETPLEIYEFEAGELLERKTIFVVRNLDEITLRLIKNTSPILAIFA